VRKARVLIVTDGNEKSSHDFFDLEATPKGRPLFRTSTPARFGRIKRNTCGRPAPARFDLVIFEPLRPGERRGDAAGPRLLHPTMLASAVKRGDMPELKEAENTQSDEQASPDGAT